MFFRLKSSQFITGLIVADCDHIPEKIIHFFLNSRIIWLRFQKPGLIFQDLVHILKGLCHNKRFDQTCGIHRRIIQKNFLACIQILDIDSPFSVIILSHGFQKGLQTVHAKLLHICHFPCFIHRKSFRSYAFLHLKNAVISAEIVGAGKMLPVRSHFKSVIARFRRHFSIFIKKVVAVISYIFHFQIIYVPDLRRGRQLPQVIYHIQPVKFLFYAGKAFYAHHMGTFRSEFSAFIMIIKPIQNCAVNLCMVKIVNGLFRRFCAVLVQTVKAFAFQKVFLCPVANRLDLGLFRSRQYVFCYGGGGYGGRRRQKT